MDRFNASTLESSAEAKPGKSSQNSKDATKLVGGEQTPTGDDQSISQAAINENRPKVTTTLWEDENTLCYQVEVRGIFVSRRMDTNFINGTKLLNLAGMTRGKRDGVLKFVPVKQVIKIGPMDLKGVWIPFQNAVEFAKHENIYDDLYPLFAEDIRSVFDRTGVVRDGASENRSSIPEAGAYPIHPNENPNTIYSSEEHNSVKARYINESSKSMSVLIFRQRKDKTNNHNPSIQNNITPNRAYNSLGHPSRQVQDGFQIPTVNGYRGYPQLHQYPNYYPRFPPQPQGIGINGFLPQAQFSVARISSSHLGSWRSPGIRTTFQIPRLRQGAQAYVYAPAYRNYGFYPYSQGSPSINCQHTDPPPPYSVSAYNYNPQSIPPKAAEEQQPIANEAEKNIQTNIQNNTQDGDKDIQNNNKNGHQELESETQTASSSDETKRLPKRRGRSPQNELEEAYIFNSLKKARKR